MERISQQFLDVRAGEAVLPPPLARGAEAHAFEGKIPKIFHFSNVLFHVLPDVREREMGKMEEDTVCRLGDIRNFREFLAILDLEEDRALQHLCLRCAEPFQLLSGGVLEAQGYDGNSFHGITGRKAF